MQIFTPSTGRAAVNIEPAICNGHMPYPWERRWRKGEGEFDAGGGGWPVKQNA